MDNVTTNSTISELLSVIDERKFNQIVNVSDIDAYIKKFSAYKFLQLFIIAQLNEKESLHALSKQLKDDQKLQNFTDLETISTSQLSRKQCTLSSQIFEKIFKHLVLEVEARIKSKQSFPKTNIGRLLVIDSSTMTMCLKQYPWASFKQTKAGIKLHLKIVVTKDLIVPDKAFLTPAKSSDRSQMDNLIVTDPETIYLFDRGYNDYAQFDKYCDKSIRFITRLKKDATIEVLSEQEPDIEHNIFHDQQVFLGNEKNGTKMKNELRLIETKDNEDNDVVIVTNCFDLTAQEIGDIYRYRWKIETFFKWMKQHLKIKTFYGKSKNAVYTQIWIALITYCLQVLLQLKFHHEGSLLEINRTLQNLLFSPLEDFIRSLFRKPSRKSKGRKKHNWEADFQFIVDQFEKGEVMHLDDLTYDPLFD